MSSWSVTAPDGTSAARLMLADNITLLPMPSYSPELNPMENVWDYLRGNKLSHTVWDNYEAIVEACTKAWRFLIEDTGYTDLSSITFPFSSRTVMLSLSVTDIRIKSVSPKVMTP